MKYLFLLLAIVFPVLAEAQIELIRPADFRYHITVDGDTVSTRSLDYKAIEDAYNYKCDYPGATVVVHPTGIEVRGSCPETIIDGAAAPADTVYQNLPPHDNSFLHSVDWTHKVDFDTGEERLNFVIETDNVDSLITEVRCGNEWVKERVFPDVEKEYPRPGNTLHYGILWDCDLDLSYHFRAHKGVWSQAITESFPAFFFSTNDVDTMADQYFTDFSHNDTGQTPSDWNIEFRANFLWNVIEDTLATGGKAMRSLGDGGSSGREGLRYTPVPESADFQIFYRFRLFDSISAELWPFYRASGDESSMTGYRVGGPAFNGGVTSAKYDNGSFSAGQSEIKSYDIGVWYNCLVISEGNRQRAKVWRADEPEPSSFDIDWTSAISSQSEGWAGLTRFNAIENAVDVDVYGVGVEGAPAPREPIQSPETLDVSGTSQSISDSTGSLMKSAPVAGMSATDIQANGALSYNADLSGQLDTYSDSNAELSSVKVLNGSSENISETKGDVDSLASLIGTSQTITDSYGLLDVISAGITSLSGRSTSEAAASGSIDALISIAGSSASESQGTASVDALISIAADSITLTGTQAVLGLSAQLSGQTITLADGSGFVSIAGEIFRGTIETETRTLYKIKLSVETLYEIDVLTKT